MDYLSTRFMLGLLKQAQELQGKVFFLNDGHSMHLDTSSTKLSDRAYHSSFSVVLFNATSIELSWEFRSYDEKEKLEQTMKEMSMYINLL